MRQLQMSITICREIPMPAEIELPIDVLFTPSFPGYFNHVTGDCDPPQGPKVEVTTLTSNIFDSIESLFDYWKVETFKQVIMYLESEEFKSDAEAQYYNSGQDCE